MIPVQLHFFDNPSKWVENSMVYILPLVGTDIEVVTNACSRRTWNVAEVNHKINNVTDKHIISIVLR